jgi:hypothetical protein
MSDTSAVPTAPRETGSGPLWLDSFARRLGFGLLADRLPWDVPPSYVYTLCTVIPLTVGAAIYTWSIGAELIYEVNPYFALQPLLLLAAVYGAHSLRAGYDRAVREMNLRERASDPEPLVDIVPERLPWLLFALAVGVQFIPGIKDTTGWIITDYVFNYVVFPFVYTPIIIQFSAVYLSIEFLAPWRLSRSDVGIHFLDPEGIGGLRPLGELIKRAYYYVVAGLIGYALITYAPFVVSEWEITPLGNVLFTSVWVLSIGTVAFAVFVLHRFMHREKRREIRRLEAELQSYVQHPYDVRAYEVPDEHQERVADLRDRITRVSSTSEYPATFSIWSQLLLSIALPKAVQLLIAGL